MRPKDRAITQLLSVQSVAEIRTHLRALGPKKIKSPWSDPAVKRVP